MTKNKQLTNLKLNACVTAAAILSAVTLAGQFSFEFNNDTKEIITVKLTNDLEKTIKPGGRSGFSRVTTEKEKSEWAILDFVSEHQDCSVHGFSLPYLLPAREAAKFEATTDEDGRCVVKLR